MKGKEIVAQAADFLSCFVREFFFLVENEMELQNEVSLSVGLVYWKKIAICMLFGWLVWAVSNQISCKMFS